jgi:predicted RNA-binding Zn ribbon-like protein
MSGHSKPHQGNRAGSITLLAGNLALNFANTESGRESPQHLNHLEKGADLVTWAGHAGVIAADDVKSARQILVVQPHLADDLLERGHVLRNTIYAINAAIADGQHSMQGMALELASQYRQLLGVADFRFVEGKYIWHWRLRTQLVAAVLGPIAVSAFELLTRQDRARIKQCNGNGCGWLFYDSTKNNSRRWCEMSVCGNRFKVRAIRVRKQNGQHKLTEGHQNRKLRS